MIFRKILFTKFLYIVKDYNYESSNKLNEHIEIQAINYEEYVIKDLCLGRLGEEEAMVEYRESDEYNLHLTYLASRQLF